MHEFAQCRVHAGKMSRPMFVRLTKQFHFEAAHFLPTFPADHKCHRMHGHSFRFDVVVAGKVDEGKGYLIDYGDIRKVVDPIVAQLDHYLLNEIAGLSNPTSEMIAPGCGSELNRGCHCCKRSAFTRRVPPPATMQVMAKAVNRKSPFNPRPPGIRLTTQFFPSAAYVHNCLRRSSRPTQFQ